MNLINTVAAFYIKKKGERGEAWKNSNVRDSLTSEWLNFAIYCHSSSFTICLLKFKNKDNII
jgi:hypothetical protein